MPGRFTVSFSLLAFGFVSIVAASESPPNFDGITDVSEYKDSPWFEGLSYRRNSNRTGPKETHVPNPAGLDERREAIIDALWKDDPGAFFELVGLPDDRRTRFKLRDFRSASKLLRPYRSEGLRTMRDHPLVSEVKPGLLWCRHQWMTLPDEKNIPARGNLHLFFNANDFSLQDVWVNRFPAENGISVLPQPDASIAADTVVERSIPDLNREPDPRFPPDYSDIDDSSEYTDRRRVSSVYGRRNADNCGITEDFVANPERLDQRREAIIDALWKDDEAAFLEHAVSPITGKGGLVNQTFSELSREFRRYRDEGLRTLRGHPIDPNIDRETENFWCRHQWMTLPESRLRTPIRGNLNLIFKTEDLSLAFVRMNEFDNQDSVNVLPYPSPDIPNDPVRDREAIEE